MDSQSKLRTASPGAGKRMKWNGTGRGLKTLAVSLAVGLGMTACSRDYTVGYLYATSATHTTTGLINAYSIDFQSGALQQLPDSPIPSSGSNPITLVASPNGKNLYVVNQNTSQVVQFAIGTDGQLYEQKQHADVVMGASGVTGSIPTAIAIDPAGKFLYVTFQYQNGFTAAKPGPGGVAVYPLAVDGTIGAPVTNTASGTSLPYTRVGNNPSGIVASPVGGYIYVIDQEPPASASGSPFGVLLAFSVNASTGALTPIPGTVSGGFAVGTTPAGIAEDPGGHYLYITDSTTNQLYAFVVQSGGAPFANLSSPFITGQHPLGVTVDPRAMFVYVVNSASGTISSYAINSSTGSLSAVAAASSSQVETSPTCVTIDPALGIYLYTSNNIGNSVSALQLNPHTGALVNVQNTPFPAQPLPTCAVAVANGVHAKQLIN